MVQCIAEWHLQPQLDEARRIREDLAIVLERYSVQNKDAFLLACAELIVNLSRYPEPKPTDVVMSLSRDNYNWWLELRDNGPSFNTFSQQLIEPTDLEASERGMGLKLLAQMFPEIKYIPACYREDAYNLMLLRAPESATDNQQSTLLIVDDDPTYRAVLKAYLNARFQVVEADCVSDGYDKALRYHPDLIICDIHMPGESGLALFDQLSHIPDVSDTAFIYLSGCKEETLIRRALSRPIDDFIVKPVSKQGLIDSVERVIQRIRYLKQQIKTELKQKVTLGLKPSLPNSIPGYNLELRCINPEAGGGDLVQIQENGDQHIMLMADLMGHGLSAKGYVYALAGYLRGLFSALTQHQINLCDLFSILSTGFNEDIVLKETLATLIAIRLTEQGEVELVNAGQPYPLLIQKNNLTPLSVDGPLPGLGISKYQSLQHQLKTGDRVLIYSDGFSDAALPLTENLISTIKKTSTMPLTSAADLILTSRLQESKLNDDLTLILIEKL